MSSYHSRVIPSEVLIDPATVPRRSRAACIFLFSLALIASPALRAQSPTQQPTTTKSNAAAQPSIFGVWFMRGNMVPGIVPPPQAPMLPATAEKFKTNTRDNDPELHCFPPGVPRVWVLPAPFEIMQLSDRVLIYYEFQHLLRQVHMNRSEHPADLIPTWMGDSNGKWEGDTLVIDSVGFNDKTRLDVIGLPHSDALHVTERLRLASPNELQLDVTIDDPKDYSAPMTAHRIYDRKPGWEIGEWVCEENNTFVTTPLSTTK
ncbi:MAG TPA: hypothetical protein VG322_16920 [Candidatus Acidoferrales bacterium]|jgi:hypothetical protein|nr:hypothetical protein [Candidatus Acidoferrales bacterium]